MAAGGIAASVLAERWAALLAAHSEHDLLVYGLFGVVVAVYWGFGLLCLALDAGQRPASLWATKLQPGRTLTGHPGDVRTPPLGRLVVVVAFNQLAVLLPYSMAQHAIHASPRVQCLALRVDAELPGLAEVVLHVLALALWEEVGFYYSHRLLHTPWLYRAVHSKHHDFHAPTALATIYAHPLEVATGNALPLVLGPLLLNCHLFTTVLWYVIAVVGSQHHHCGYSWPRGRSLCGGGLFSVLTPAPQPHFHDFHHERGGGAPGAGNYGLLGVLDWLHGTDRPWREHCHALSAAAAAAKRA